MPMDASEIERLIKSGIPDAEVTIRDLAGDGDHYAATVIAESFRGKSRVQQHQIVYEALRGQMGGALHALALQTGVPEAEPARNSNALSLALVGSSGGGCCMHKLRHWQCATDARHGWSASRAASHRPTA